ncbi:MAG TPA: hypothetical protein VGR03_02105 [Candidatus Acidoferrum sp.]|nr:hypothetical protein [Candidatus Acidoferrum sp.]
MRQYQKLSADGLAGLAVEAFEKTPRDKVEEIAAQQGLSRESLEPAIERLARKPAHAR